MEAVGMTKHFPTFENMSASVRKTESEVEKTEKLNLLLLNAVDETLKHVFKKPGAEAIYNYIENECHLKREEIAEKTNVFRAGLERMLGSGALMIEKMILKNIHRKLKLKFKEKQDCEFADYVKKLRKMYGCQRKGQSQVRQKLGDTSSEDMKKKDATASHIP